MTNEEMLQALNTMLMPQKFKDAAENGLQIEGKSKIKKVVLGVSANVALIDAAIEAKADAILVHHGLIWGGGIRQLKGWLKERVQKLLAHNINLYAYHLPIDAHPALGNNAALLKCLSATEKIQDFGFYKGKSISFAAERKESCTLRELIAEAEVQIGPLQHCFGDLDRKVRSIAVCSGGAPDLFQEAIDSKYDVFLSGEATEWIKAVADESETAFLSFGHHNTEVFGVQAVGHELQKMGLDIVFHNVQNPV